MNQTLIIFLCIAFLLAAASAYCMRNSDKIWIFSGGSFIVGAFLSTMFVLLASASATSDIEILNGKILDKKRIHDSYVESYECMCTTDSKGNRSCSTCYRDHYTVEWLAISTIEEFRIKKLDETSRRVYSKPDPEEFTQIKIGEPVAIRHRYTNYVQAVPNSLFARTKGLEEKFKQITPAYPDQIYARWKNDHVVSAGLQLADHSQWNDRVAMGLRDIGAQKQVNLIFLIAKTNDPNYEYVIRDAWDNANKNDVVVIIGSTDYPKIDFARVITWSKNEMFKVELRENILEYGKVDSGLTDVALTQINKNFERRHMKEFEYLKNEIDPPNWVLILLSLILIGGNIALVMNHRKF